MIPFLRYRAFAYVFSLLLILLSSLSLYLKGLNLGLDFTGGTVLELRFQNQVELSRVRKALTDGGVSGFQLQESEGSIILIKLSLDQDPERVRSIISKLGNFELLRFETIGPVVTSELRKKATFAVIFALLGILIYLAYRYEPIWALSAILALLHDVLIVLGAYSLSFREINLDVIAALLIVAGYSVTDTVVIFDRIRENLRIRKATSLENLVDISVNQTLSRTIMTSVTTFVVSLSLFIFGGPALSNIMFAFVVGVIVGTFSSVFVAGALLSDIRSKLLPARV
ncbi:MAG: protein translocase subunit SecF [Aquificaceae bacterium]|nr:protein translocase subunit SecF [Aquificaceae bacterium]MDW8237460.1 protein translocase subunit SecF [Aquificaceae bacterium]